MIHKYSPICTWDALVDPLLCTAAMELGKWRQCQTSVWKDGWCIKHHPLLEENAILMHTYSGLNIEIHEPKVFPTKHFEKPSIERLFELYDEGLGEATDGCMVEADGVCPHGCRSILAEEGFI